MTLIKTLKGITPSFGKEVFLAENATLIGDIQIGDESSVWYSAVLRGDVGPIRIGNRSNVQDLAMIHCTFEQSSTTIGDNVTIGHSAIVHGATIKDCSLIGMGAVILDKAVVGKHVIVGAKSVVLEGMVLEEGYLYAGAPAKKIKPLSVEQIEGLQSSADHYVFYGKWYNE